MRFRIPQPIHGWRQFAGEVGIIVVGVLIALGAQEIVEDRSWATQIRDARVSLDAQLADSQLSSMERIANAACTNRKLDFVDEVIAGTRPAAGLTLKIGGLRLWSTSAWGSATASGAVARMPAALRNTYADLFSFTAALGEMNRAEFETGTALRTLERHTTLTDVSRDRLAAQVAKMRALNGILKLGATQWLDNAKPLALKLPDEAGARAYLVKAASQCILPDGRTIDPRKAAA